MRKIFLKKIIFFWAVLAFLSLGVICLKVFVYAADTSSPDAIAIRVIPNPKNFSAVRWYKENIKGTGSPQNLIVDGYQAVRDGRTVYVNAANIVSGNFYTNIYLISYNQESETATVDIFGQILAHWKFNTNVEEKGNCNSAAAASCAADEDCAGQAGDYCLSDKAKIVRDTKRLADLADLNSAMAAYLKNNNQNYPRLSAGSYLAGKSVSVWPSWQDTLGKELGLALPLDPVNKLGSCPVAYSAATCWDEKNKSFYFNFGETGQNLISAALVYYYQDGQFFINLESRGAYAFLQGTKGINFSDLESYLEFSPALKDLKINNNFTKYDIRVIDRSLKNPNIYKSGDYNLAWSLSDDNYGRISIKPMSGAKNQAQLTVDNRPESQYYKPIEIVSLHDQFNGCQQEVSGNIAEASNKSKAIDNDFNTGWSVDNSGWRNIYYKYISGFIIEFENEIINYKNNPLILKTKIIPKSSSPYYDFYFWQSGINGSCAATPKFTTIGGDILSEQLNQDKYTDNKNVFDRITFSPHQNIWQADEVRLEKSSLKDYLVKVIVKDKNKNKEIAGSFKLISVVCNNGVVEGDEKCDKTVGIPSNATCKSDCSGWVCNSGYHKDSNNCVSNTASCTIANGVGEKQWPNWSICKVKTCDTNYHIEGNNCESNTWENNPSCLTAGVKKAVQTGGWDDGVWKWGNCEVKECNWGNNYYKVGGECKKCAVTDGIAKVIDGNCQITGCNETYYLKDGQCNKCAIADATAQVVDGKCQVKTCNDSSGYHVNSAKDACVSNTASCSITNGQGEKTWDTSINNWSTSCQAKSCNRGYHFNYDKTGCTQDAEVVCNNMAIINGAMKSVWSALTGWSACEAKCEASYPFYVAKYNNTSEPACVNACGLSNNNDQITLTYNTLCSLDNLYVPKLKSLTFNGHRSLLKDQINDNCGTNGFSVTRPVSDFISNNKCQFIYKSNMPATEPTITEGGRILYTNTQMVNSAVPCVAEKKLDKYWYIIKWDEQIFTKLDITDPATNWEFNDCADPVGFSSSFSTGGASQCVPTTCQAQGKNCGSISDNCGGNLNCGSCVSGTCVNNVCPANIAPTVIYPATNGDNFENNTSLTFRVRAVGALSVKFRVKDASETELILADYLYDDGDHGDGAANDGVWGYTWSDVGKSIDGVYHTGAYHIDLVINDVEDPNNPDTNNLRSFNIVAPVCAPVVNNVGSNKLNIVYIADISYSAATAYSGVSTITEVDSTGKSTVTKVDYSTGKNLNDFKNDVIKFKDKLLSYEPFKTQKNKINFWRIENKGDLGCNYNYNGKAHTITFCDTAEVKTKALSCPADVIGVLLNSNDYGGASDPVSKIFVAYGGIYIYPFVNFVYDGEKVGVHEFGHAFGRLKDEYSYGDAPAGPDPYYMFDGGNCDKNAGCLTWSGLSGAGCFNTGGGFVGCQYNQWFRPKESGSIMLDNTGDFNAVGERRFKDLLNAYQ